MVVSLWRVGQNSMCTHLHVDASYVQGNTPIARDGNTYLGAFGVACPFTHLWGHQFRF